VARRYFKRNGARQRVVDYRHLIGALIKKPQAFRLNPPVARASGEFGPALIARHTAAMLLIDLAERERSALAEPALKPRCGPSAPARKSACSGRT